MIVAEIDGFRCGRRISTTYQVVDAATILRSVLRSTIAWDAAANTPMMPP